MTFNRYVNFANRARHLRCNRLQASPNEQQYFDDLVVPAFEGAFALSNFAVRRFEVPVYGSSGRRNAGKDLLFERQAQGHQADAVVETAEALQLVIVKCSKMSENTSDKEARDHYKPARNLKDTWTRILKETVKDCKQPRPFAIFSLQVYESDMTFLAMDFRGCYRLYELATVRIPNSCTSIKKYLGLMLKTCVSFAGLVKAHHRSLDQLTDLSYGERRAFGLALRSIEVTSVSPTKISKAGKRKRMEDDGI
ncbi:hypothetical protein BC939DRAFT_69122 [Gamsiella multidivaricata]|uniref:uncharacterized protein n=1 Tax=Gamsiella multidivaricata TaxID=101098 RepID=UPI00221FE186|nr:uncharacterized protein BC939DRAFT_69122 [Gamsiella multidivaricata]KAI7828140.1 hypothetical protein BC939DRAFT_69122 [Gamsiella multidivaricata]